MFNLKNIVLNGFSLDKGFFVQRTFQLLEELSLFYMCKASQNTTASIKKMNEYLSDEDGTPISETYDSAELTVPLPAWEKASKKQNTMKMLRI